MYEVLDKDTIKSEILPYLSVAKRGYVTKSDLVEVIQCILYKLKTGCQWHMLPVSAIFTGRVLSYKSVYAHFRKWSRNGEWKKVWGMMLSRHRSFLDMSSVDLDGSHTTTLRGGECCGYQGRKKRTTTNAIYVTDRQGIPLAMSTPVSGSHNDLHCISEVLQGLFAGIEDSGLSVSGLFLNADAGFDSAQFRRDCHRQEVFPNVAFNKRRGMRRDDELLDELLYKERYSIERTNAWMDSYRSVLNRFDTTQTSWEGWNYIAFILIFLKKIRKREKSRWLHSINTSNKKKVRRRFFTKGEEHTNLLQIGLDVNATFDKDLFQNLIKVIKVGECFNLFFITNNQDNLKLSYSDILPHIVILDEYLVLKELHLSKNIFTPSFFYNSCSIIIPLEKFYQYIKKDLTEE